MKTTVTLALVNWNSRITDRETATVPIEKEIRRKIEHRLGILLLSFLFSQNPLYYFSNHGKLEPTTKKMIDNPSST